MQVHVYIRVWHPTYVPDVIQKKLRWKVLESAAKGDPRGKSTSRFHENYCRFDVGAVEPESEAQITQAIIASISPLNILSELAVGGGRVWITAHLPKDVYEVSISPEEMERLGAARIGLSYDVSS